VWDFGQFAYKPGKFAIRQRQRVAAAEDDLTD
jgi:hypothetical protein